MVATKVLDEALRGGEPARLLEERCKQRLQQAEDAVRAVVSSAPEFLAEAKEQHEMLVKSGDSLTTELEMLGESLDDVTESSRQMMQRAKTEAMKEEALRELGSAVVPYVIVADALEESDNMGNKDFGELQKTRAVVESAVVRAVESGRLQLTRTVSELEERADAATAMMKSRYMDMFEIRPHSIVARGKESVASVGIDGDVGVASAALENCGLLHDAMGGIVSELVRNRVADGIAKATVFFENKTDSQSTLEWRTGNDSSAELLEFEIDDIEMVSDEEADALAEQLDISNAVARALKIYEVLRENVVGINYSRELAEAMHPWLSEHVLPSSVVLSSRRSIPGDDNIPREALRSRVAAVSASAKILQMAMQSRGATSFRFVVETGELEATVGSECRAQAVLVARRATATFANARHDDNDMVACPIAADHYMPRDKRPPEYFAPCLVSKAALAVQDIFLSTRKDAVNALEGGSTGIGGAMNAAAVECLRAYREDVPIQHGEDLRASLRLKALYYNDCMMFAHSSRLSALASGLSPELSEEIESLEAAAHKAMMVVRRAAEQRLVENLKAACRNGALGAYGTLTRIQRGSALSAAFSAMREVVSVFADVVPTEIAELAAGRLLEKYLTMLCNEVVALPEISADGCDQIESILVDADTNVESLMGLVKSMDVVRAGAPPPEIIIKMRRVQRRMHVIREILSARMEDIVTAYRSGRYQDLVSRQEVEHFIRAIFEDTALRASFIRDMDVSLEQETGEWENSNW